MYPMLTSETPVAQSLSPGSVVFWRSLLNSSSTMAPPLAATSCCEALRMPEDVVIGCESAAGHADEMKSVDFQIFHQGVQIICDGAWLRTSGRIRPAAAPSPPIESDNRYPASTKPAMLYCQLSALPVFAWSSMTGTPLPPLSVYHRRTPGDPRIPRILRSESVLRFHQTDDPASACRPIVTAPAPQRLTQKTDRPAPRSFGQNVSNKVAVCQPETDVNRNARVASVPERKAR